MDLHQEIDNIDDFALMTVDQADDNVVLPIELMNTTGTCLQQLNAHCLMEIFSSSSLTLTDLCSIAETCTRFKEIAEMIFPKDLSVSNVYNFDNEYKLKSKKYGKYCCSMQVLERILKNLGPYVSAVSMKRDDELLKPVAKYCSTATLQHLHVWGLPGGQGKDLTRKLKSIFQRMLALSFRNCDLTLLVPCPHISCDSLIELEIINSSDCGTILRNTFPKLERFTFYGNLIFEAHNDAHDWRYIFPIRCDDNFSEILPNFLRRHKHLITLHLSSGSVCCSSQLMETIDNNCTELVNLTLERWRSPKTSFNFSYLKHLRKLSMLAVSLDQIDHPQLIALLEVLKSLMTLKLIHVNDVPTQLFSVLSQLPNLRELHLEYGDMKQIPWSMLTQLKALYIEEMETRYLGSHLPHIISELTNLEELAYYYFNLYEKEYDFELSSEEFSEIVKIVERRPFKLTLRTHLGKDLAKNYVPNKNVNLIEYTG